MKTKSKPLPRKVSAKHAVATVSSHRVVPLNERRLTFGNKWDYAPAPEDSKAFTIAPRHELFIDGKFVAPLPGKYFDSINPATEEKLTEIAAANEQDVDLAVKAARRAYDKVWSKMPGRERGKYLYRIARIIQEKARELAVLETMDGGKTIKESRDVDLPLVAAHFFYHAGWADKLQYAFPGRMPQPLGVAGQIIPWNFPLLMAAWKIAPALACGNTVVIKPAETTSITAMRLAQIFQEAGIAGWRRQHRHRRGRNRRGHRESSGHQQNRVHRFDRSRQVDRQSRRRHRQKIDARTGRQGGEHHFRGRAD